MIRFTAKEISVEIEGSGELVSLVQKCLEKLTSVDEKPEPQKRAMTDAERAKKYRENKKNRDAEQMDVVTVRDDSVTSDTKEERDEERAVSPLDSPLSSSPIPLSPITPLIPSSQKEAEREEKQFAPAAQKRGAAVKPSDHDFWKFAREHADLAEAIYRAAGIFPVKKEFGRWINDLRDLAEAGITVQDIAPTVYYMRRKNLPIGAPGSLLKTARWLKTQPVQPSGDRWERAAQKVEAELASMYDSPFMGLFGKPDDSEVIDL